MLREWRGGVRLGRWGGEGAGGSQLLAADEVLFVIDKVVAALLERACVDAAVLAGLGRVRHADGPAQGRRGEFVVSSAIVAGGVGEGALSFRRWCFFFVEGGGGW